jgi:hypothetical protein
LCEAGGVVLDLTCVPPSASIEVDNRSLGRLRQERFLERAARTEHAVSLLIEEGLLVEEASLAHDVRKHYETGRELIEDIDQRRFSRLPPALRKTLTGIEEPVVEHAPCLLRRLRVLSDAREPNPAGLGSAYPDMEEHS